MHGLATIIAHNTLAALLLAAIVWPVTRFVRRPAVAHILWLLVLLRLIAPPIVSIEYALWPPTSAPPAATVNEQPTPTNSVAATPGRLNNRLKLGRPASQLTNQPAVASQPSTATPTLASGALAALPQLALGVTAVLALVAAIRITRFRRLVTKLEPASDDLHAIVAQSATKLGLTRIPDVRVGTLAGAPFVWNLGRRPTIVLPASFVESFDPTQLAMILTHELAHLRRRDHWVRCLELLVAVTHWWNPLAHWVRRRMHVAEEQACDAWVAWAFPTQAQQYAELLLQAASLAAPRHVRSPWLISPLFRVHPLKARIAMIVQGRTPHRNSRLATLLLSAAALIALPSYVMLTAADEKEPASPDTSASKPTAEPQTSSSVAAKPDSSPDDPARLNVTVLVSGTNEPVEGATAIGLLGYFETEGNIATRTGKTDAEGKCSLSVPYGHLNSWWPFLPAGYWFGTDPENPEQHEAFITSPSSPTYAQTFFVQRGTVWNIRAHDADTSERVGQLQCNITPMDPKGFRQAGPTVLDAQGQGQFTPPGTGGNYRLDLFGPFNIETSIRSWMQFRHVGEPGLTIDEGFDPNLIAEIQPGTSDSESVLVDRNGRKTQLRGATAVIENGTLFIDVAVRRWIPNSEAGRGIGTVVDLNGEPVANARVVLRVQLEDSQLSWTGWQARTDAAGLFEIEQISVAAAPGTESASARLVATASADGFAPQNSAPTAYPAAPGQAADFGRITLAAGHSARIRVLDVLGGPAVGAVVTPTFDLQPTRRNITDERGEVLVRDLPAGNVTLAAAYGADAGMLEISTPVSDDNRVFTIRLQPKLGIDVRAGGLVPVAGPAPPLQVSAWTDGNDRKIEDFKGRVVVLYFWDIAEEGCDQELAIIGSLRQKFVEDGVVFLGIHAARQSLDEVTAWMKEKDWRMPTGLDKFDDSKASLTTTAYGVSTPSFVVIGRDGRITFNQDAVMNDDGGERLYHQAAQALNIDLHAEELKSEQNPDQQGCDVCTQILEYIQTRAIQNALGPPTE